jgi:hypothetical protein
VDVWRRRDSPGANADGGFRSIQALLGVARATQRTSARQAPCSWPRAGDRYATAADAEPSGLRRIGALEGGSPLGRMALNLHRMKKFQGTAELSWVVEVRPTLRKRTPDRPAPRLPAAESEGSQNHRPQPEPPEPETRANWAFHRIPAQSRKYITDDALELCGNPSMCPSSWTAPKQIIRG